MANKKISQLDNKASLGLSDLLAVGDPSTGYLYKTTINDLKTLTGAGVISFNGRIGAIVPTEGDYTLTQLGDVIVTTPASGHILKYNGSNWVNVAMYTGTSAQYVDGTGAYQTFPTMLSSDRLITEVRNQSGSTITKGSVIYLSGSSGTLPLILKAQANAEATSSGTYGVVQNDISNNSTGYVVVIGILTSLDTSAYNAGDILWLSPTVAGGYTTTKPSAPNNAVYVGIVTRSHATQGTIEVKIQNGYELEELHNVSISSVANNDFLVYESATSLWKNKTLSTVLGFTPISLSSLSASAPLSYNNSTGAFSISQASGSTNGYLSSTDWNTFNNKQSALGYTAADDSLVVHKAGTETITGTKTFSSTTTASKIRIDNTALSEGTTVAFKQYESGAIGETGYTSLTAQGASLFYINWGGTKSAILDSVNLTADRTYTLPNASGTLALLSDIPSLTGYVTLATTQTITGAKTFSNNLYIDTNAYWTKMNPIAAITGTMNLYAPLGSSSSFVFLDGDSGKSARFNFDNTANRIYTFPTASGTLALLSDIPSLSGTAPISYTAGVISISQASTSTNGYLSSTDWNTFNGKQDALGFTAVPNTRTLTINGTTHDLSANRSWTIPTYSLPVATSTILGGVKIGSGVSVDLDGVISVSTSYQAPLSGTGFVKISGTTISYDNSTYLTGITSLQVTTALGYTPYNSTNPSGYTSNTGTVTSVSGTGTVSGLTLTGTVTTSGSLTLGGTLSLTSGQVTGALGYTPYNSTNPSGYITGINSTMVTNALGYTPYNSSNPSGYITSSGSITGSAGSVSLNSGVINSSAWAGGGSYNGYTFTGGNSRFGFSSTSGYVDVYIDGNFYAGIDLNGLNNLVLHTGNYNSYAPTLTGGNASGTWGISISGNSANTSSISNATGNNYTWTGLNYFKSNKGAGVYMSATSNAPLQAFSDDSGTAMMSFHRGGYYAINMGLDPDNVFRIGGWSASGSRLQMDMSGNLTMAGDITAYSDARVKENVVTIDNALSKLLALRGVYYNRIDSDDKKRKVGVIAQETEVVLPEVVNIDNSGMYNVSYGNMAGLFIEAIKEQQKVIDQLKAKLDAFTK